MRSGAGWEPAAALEHESCFHAQGLLQAASPHRLEAALVLKGRCGLPARTAWKQLWCTKAAASFQLAQPLPAHTAWKQLSCSRAAAGSQPWCPRAAAGCQPAPLRTAWKQPWCSKAAASCQLAPPLRTAWTPHCLETALVQRPLRAASPYRLVLKGRCGLPPAGGQPAPLGSSFVAQKPLRAATPHRSALLGDSSAACRCGLPARIALLGDSFGKGRCAHRLEAALVGCQPAPLGSSFGAQKPLRAASPHKARGPPHCLEAALVLKGRRALPARTAWKQLWCSKAAAGCQPAPLKSSSKAAAGCQPSPLRTPWRQLFGAQSPHRLEAALVLKGCCGLPGRTAPHCLEAALVLKGRCGLPGHAAPHRLEAALVL